MTTYIINDLLSDAATDAGCNAFGIGHRAYDNLATGRTTPFCWINSIDFETQILENVSFLTTYSVTGNIAAPANFDAPPEDIQAAIQLIEPIYERFISYLAERAIEFKRAFAMQLYHYHDDHHVGIDFQFKIQIAKDYNYSCP